VSAVAFEDRMFTHANFDVKIAGRTAVSPRLAFAGQTNAIAVVDARRDFY
jgi:hypothetical protein